MSSFTTSMHNSNSGSGGGGAGGNSTRSSGGQEPSDNMRMVLHEGPLRVRQGNKWKSRWCVLSLSSPVSDKLRFTFKKEIKRQRDRKAAEYKEKFFFDCVDYCGMIPELRIDSCQHAMCVVFAKKMLTLGFETKYTQTDWECRIRSVYGEENLFTFSVQIPSNSPSGILSRMRSSTNAMMFIFNDNIAFVAMPDDDVPQKLASMKLSSVESYGADAKTRSIMLKLKKKAYRFESHMPDAILKALDHVSGRRLLHESEGSVSEDLRSEMEFADYGQAVSDLFMQPMTDLGVGGMGASLSSPGGAGTGGNALSHNNLLYKMATNPPTSGMPTIDVNDCPFDDGTLDINTTGSERTHQYTLSPRQSMASQHLQERSMLSLDDKNSLATNTMSSNTSQNAFGATLNNNMMTDFYAAAHRDSPTPTQGSYISNTNAASFNFRQPSPSNTVPNSYTQDPTSVQIAVNVDTEASRQSHCPSDLVPPPVPKRMSALYHKDTDRPSVVDATASSRDSSRPGADPFNSAGHQLFAASTALSNIDRNTDPFGYTVWPPGTSIPAPDPHPFAHRPPPSIPIRTGQPYPQHFLNTTQKSHKQFVARPSASNFFCGSCGLRRWISCPDVCISSFTSVNNPIDLSYSARDQHNTWTKQPTSPLLLGNSSFVQNFKKNACTARKCRNQQLANQLSAMNASLCFKHLAFLKLPWLRCNSEIDSLALPRISKKISLGQEKHRNSRTCAKQTVRGAVHAEGKSDNFISCLNPYSANVANGFSEENVAFSGSGSIEIEDSSLGLDGVSVMISGHSRDSVTAVSTPSYDWEYRLESSRNSNIKSRPNGVKNKSSSRAEFKHEAPHQQVFQQRPGTAPNMFANEAPNMTPSSFYDTNLSSGSERVSNVNNNINSSTKTTTTTSNNANGAKTVTSVHNPFSLQLKHQTTLDPQGNVQNHLYINLDYPHTQPHSIVTSTPTATEATSGATVTTSSSHFNRGGSAAPGEELGGLAETGPNFQFPYQQHHNFRSQQVPFKPPGVRSSYADSFQGGVKAQKPLSISGKKGGKLDSSSTTAAKSANSNYSQLSNFSNVLSSRNNPAMILPPHKNLDNERSKKSSLTDLYQNLDYQPSTSSPPSTTGYKLNDVGGAPFGELLLEGAAQSQKGGPMGHDLFNVTSSSGNNRSNGEDVERRRRRVKADHSKATNAAVNRWIDNAVELSNYSRDNSPDTFIATAASISDSRDDVFLTDTEQQLPTTGHNTPRTSNLQSRIPQMNLPPNPPPRQKTHNYHNIDPDLNIKHIHCPDNELMSNNPHQNIPPVDSHGIESTSHKSNSPWQNVTPSRKPGGRGVSTKFGAPSPKKVSSTKPPLSASSQGSSRFQSEIALRKSSDTYRSINSSLNQNVSDSGINLGFDDCSAFKPNDSDLSIGPPRDFCTPADFSSQRGDFPFSMQAGATNIFQYSSKGGNGPGLPSQSGGGGFHQYSSSNAAASVAVGSIKSPPPSGLGSATPPTTASSWSHNISANRRSHSESRKPVSAVGSKASAAPGLQFSAAAQGRPLGPSSTNQVVNYSVMDDSWAKLGANHASSHKSHQVSKAEKALVQYSQVDQQLTKALHEAAIQHETDRNNFSTARRKSSGRSSHLSRHHAMNSERHASISGVNQSRAASAAANASHR